MRRPSNAGTPPEEPAPWAGGFLLLLVLLGAPLPGASEVKVSIRAAPTKATVGDRIELFLRFTRPREVEVKIPRMTALGEFTVLGEKRKTRARSGGDVEEDVSLTLTVFSTGTLAIPSLRVTLLSPGKEPATTLTEPVPIDVESVLAKYPDRGDIQDLKGQLGLSRIFPWLTALATLLAAAGLLAALRRRSRAGGGISGPPVPPRPPDEEAKEDLRRLAASRLIEEGRIKDFYIALSETLRRYLQGRFGAPCLDMTTSEILAVLKAVLGLEAFQVLRELLPDFDLVKFARYRPPPEKPPRDLAGVIAFVDLTSPRREPAAGRGAKAP